MIRISWKDLDTAYRRVNSGTCTGNHLYIFSYGISNEDMFCVVDTGHFQDYIPIMRWSPMHSPADPIILFEGWW